MSSPTLKGIRILIVEDYEDNRNLLIFLLQDLGCLVEWVSDGQQALDRLLEEAYDIVLMDCQMPVMDGYEATRLLRQREGDQQRTIVIGLTAHAMAGDREKCLDAGMDDYLSKPVLSEDLAATIERWAGTLSRERQG